ncbi:hypothetical protein ABIE26_000230 [Pedobacter africanus]|uniref:Uncharacterized protein n=1 Tax=Pedobacter africanus TaxID=151894 RepID=A0ACC6KVL6_9SPHI|nr:hypothetical protein [Pedobacter africanus]
MQVSRQIFILYEVIGLDISTIVNDIDDLFAFCAMFF